MPDHAFPSPSLPLFVPADRPERYAKAAAAGADAVIVDLEDAVAEGAKDAARTALVDRLRSEPLAVPLIVRVNAADTRFHEADIAALEGMPSLAVMLPKAEDPATIATLRKRLGTHPLHALIETPKGMARAREIAETASRLAFGSIDYAVSLSMTHNREALLAARSELVLASALAGKPAPIDGVTAEITNADAASNDAAYACSLGFGGKLLIHPAQIAPAIRGFAPEQDAVDEAREVLARAQGAAVKVGGRMVDAPVVDAARKLIARHEAAQARLAKIGSDV